MTAHLQPNLFHRQVRRETWSQQSQKTAHCFTVILFHRHVYRETIGMTPGISWQPALAVVPTANPFDLVGMAWGVFSASPIKRAG
jgi:hypothetical protein